MLKAFENITSNSNKLCQIYVRRDALQIKTVIANDDLNITHVYYMSAKKKLGLHM